MTLIVNSTVYRKVRGSVIVHLAAWHPGTKGWEPVCAQLRNTAVIGHGWPEIADTEPTTCSRCVRIVRKLGTPIGGTL